MEIKFNTVAHAILSYPIVEEDSKETKAQENNQSHKQESAHHGEIVLQKKY